MIRRFLLLITLSCALTMGAQDISLAQAEATARGFVRTQRMAHGAAAPRQVTLTPVALEQQMAERMYVFNVGEQDGFVVVSGSSLTPQSVLGYCDAGYVDPEAMPENFKYWLQCYAEEIQYMNEHPMPSNASAKYSLTGNVPPLLGNQRWNQNAPFNKLVIGDGVTGCVATSMAEVMSYHKWPLQGTGSHSYWWQGKVELSVDFSQSIYDWDNMLPFYGGEYTDEQADAVARLMYDCGVAIDMDYGNTSYAYTADVLPALVNYFGYDNSVRRVMRDEYPMDEWMQLLCNELDFNRPIMFEGRNYIGGAHSFVMDGYNSDGYFHINWGWGGIANGYYLLTAMDPYSQGIGGSAYGYSNYQGAIIGIQKKQKQDEAPPFVEPQLHATSILLTKSEDNPKTSFNIEVTELTNQSGFSGGFVCLFDLMREDESIIQTYGYQWPNGLPSWLPPPYNSFSLSPIDISDLELENGEYYIRPRFVTAAEPNIDREIRTKFTQAKKLKLMVDNDTILLDNGIISNPIFLFNNLTPLTERKVAGHLYMFSIDIENQGDSEFFGGIRFNIEHRPWIGNTPPERIYSDVYTVDLKAGEKQTLNAEIMLPDSAGMCWMGAQYITQTNEISMGQFVGSVNLEGNEEQPQLVLVQQLQPSEPVMPLERIAGKAVLRNDGGYCDDILEVLITPGNKSSIFGSYSQRIFLNAGEEKEIEFVGELLNAAYDTDYRMVLRNPNKPNTPTPWGSLKTFRTGPEPIVGDVNGDGIVDVSDVNIVINMMLGKSGLSPAADLNGDGKVDVSDINAIINIMLGK